MSATASGRESGPARRIVPADYPRALVARELAGMVAGPFLYLASRRRNPPSPPAARPTRPETGARLVGSGSVIGAAPRRIPILLYHSVCDDPAPLLREWSVTPTRFR